MGGVVEGVGGAMEELGSVQATSLKRVGCFCRPAQVPNVPRQLCTGPLEGHA